MRTLLGNVAEGFRNNVRISRTKRGNAPHHQHSSFVTFQPFHCFPKLFTEQHPVETYLDQDLLSVFKHACRFDWKLKFTLYLF